MPEASTPEHNQNKTSLPTIPSFQVKNPWIILTPLVGYLINTSYCYLTIAWFKHLPDEVINFYKYLARPFLDESSRRNALLNLETKLKS